MADDDYQKAQKLIARARSDSATTLNLSGLISLERLPPEVSNLRYLRTLNLSGTDVSDISAVSNLKHLERLMLDTTSVTDLSPISSLRSLVSLSSSGTRLSDISPLTRLTALATLDIRNSDVYDLRPLRELTSLEQVNIGYTRVDDLSWASQMTTLWSLDVSHTKIGDMSPIKHIASMRHLNISNTKVYDLSWLVYGDWLEELDVSDTPISELDQLLACRRIMVLRLNGTKVVDIAPVLRSRNLKTLEFSRTWVSDFSPLEELRSLKALSFSNTPVSNLSPLSGLINLVLPGASGLEFMDCLKLPKTLQEFSQLPQPERTFKTINYLREQQGLNPLPPIQSAGELSMKEFILWLLSTEIRPFSIDEIVEHFSAAGYSAERPSIRGRLNTLTSEGRIARISRGMYASLEYEKDQAVSDVGDESLPDIPDQLEGPAFSISLNGKIGFLKEGTVSETDDIDRVEKMRNVLLRAVDDLLRATVNSNAFAPIYRVASSYREVLAVEITELSLELLYLEGLRLDIARSRLEIEIANGDAPEAGMLVGEALDSVIALHGPIVLSTKSGRDMFERSREYNDSLNDKLEYKEKANKFARVFARTSADELLEPEVRETLEGVNLEVAEGRFPDRSTNISRWLNNNFFITLANVALVPLVGAGLLASVPGLEVANLTTSLANATSSFLAMHGTEMCALAMVAGPELTWFASFYAWWKRRKFHSKS